MQPQEYGMLVAMGRVKRAAGGDTRNQATPKAPAKPKTPANPHYNASGSTGVMSNLRQAFGLNSQNNASAAGGAARGVAGGFDRAGRAIGTAVEENMPFRADNTQPLPPPVPSTWKGSTPSAGSAIGGTLSGMIGPHPGGADTRNQAGPQPARPQPPTNPHYDPSGSTGVMDNFEQAYPAAGRNNAAAIGDAAKRFGSSVAGGFNRAGSSIGEGVAQMMNPLQPDNSKPLPNRHYDPSGSTGVMGNLGQAYGHNMRNNASTAGNAAMAPARSATNAATAAATAPYNAQSQQNRQGLPQSPQALATPRQQISSYDQLPEEFKKRFLARQSAGLNRGGMTNDHAVQSYNQHYANSTKGLSEGLGRNHNQQSPAGLSGLAGL